MLEAAKTRHQLPLRITLVRCGWGWRDRARLYGSHGVSPARASALLARGLLLAREFGHHGGAHLLDLRLERLRAALFKLADHLQFDYKSQVFDESLQ